MTTQGLTGSNPATVECTQGPWSHVKTGESERVEIVKHCMGPQEKCKVLVSLYSVRSFELNFQYNCHTPIILEPAVSTPTKNPAAIRTRRSAQK